MTTDDLRTRARAEAERRWPTLTEPHSPVEWHDTGMNSGFVLGALWHAAQRPSQEPAHVQVAARKAGKSSALADAIVERANAQGLRVEFVTPSPTREQIAQTQRGLMFCADHVGNGAFEDDKDDPCEDCWRHRYNTADAVLALLNGADR